VINNHTTDFIHTIATNSDKDKDTWPYMFIAFDGPGGPITPDPNPVGLVINPLLGFRQEFDRKVTVHTATGSSSQTVHVKQEYWGGRMRIDQVNIA